MQESYKKISVVIVTYNREPDLMNLLGQLDSQALRADEVIVINNGNKCRVDLERRFPRLHVCEILNDVNSLTKGRNLGASLSTGELVFFLDDDINITSSYLANLTKYMEQHPEVPGCSGNLWFSSRPQLTERFNKFFRLFSVSGEKGRVFRSIQGNLPAIEDDNVAWSQWLSGTNQCYRSEVLKSEKWDENLVLYCEGEDLDFSLRVSRRFGDLAILNLERVIHNVSPLARLPAKRLILMQEVYGLYLVDKLFGLSLGSLLEYYWSRIGRVAYFSACAVRSRDPKYVRVIWWLLWSFFVSQRNFSAIRAREFSKINMEFFS